MTHPAEGTKFLVSFENPPCSTRILPRGKIRCIYFASKYFYRSIIFFFFFRFHRSNTINNTNKLFRLEEGKREEVSTNENSRVDLDEKRWENRHQRNSTTLYSRVSMRHIKRRRRNASRSSRLYVDKRGGWGRSEGERKKRRRGYPASDEEGEGRSRDHGKVNRAKSIINHGEFVVINEDRVVPTSINTVNTRQMDFAY